MKVYGTRTNYASIEKKMKVGRAARRTLDQVNRRFGKFAEKVKNEFLDKVDNHVVSQEISSGTEGSNISGTLGNRSGNLFTFIGFSAGSDPVGELLDFLNQRIEYKPATKIIGSGKRTRTLAYLTFPEREEFDKQLPLPYENGRSWIWGIERGISSLGAFIAKEGYGNSEGGFMLKKKYFSGDFNPTNYMSKMYIDLTKRWKGISGR